MALTHRTEAINEHEHQQWCAALFMLRTTASAAELYVHCYMLKSSYHDSTYKGEDWLHDLLKGHPAHFCSQFSINKHVFRQLVAELWTVGLTNSRRLTLEEHVATFLYSSVTGLSIWLISEWFQHAFATISWWAISEVLLCPTNSVISICSYFKTILHALSSPPIYSKYVCLPTANTPTLIEIQNNPKFYPFFQDVVGAIDRTHIPCNPSAEEHHKASQNWKGGVSQNCLAACLFDLWFQYVLSGWEGSIADMAMYCDACANDLSQREKSILWMPDLVHAIHF